MKLSFKPHRKRPIIDKQRFQKALRTLKYPHWYGWNQFDIQKASVKLWKFYYPLAIISILYAIADVIFICIEIFR